MGGMFFFMVGIDSVVEIEDIKSVGNKLVFRYCNYPPWKTRKQKLSLQNFRETLQHLISSKGKRVSQKTWQSSWIANKNSGDRSSDRCVGAFKSWRTHAHTHSTLRINISNTSFTVGLLQHLLQRNAKEKFHVRHFVSSGSEALSGPTTFPVI